MLIITALSSNWLGYRPFKPGEWVQIPSASSESEGTKMDDHDHHSGFIEHMSAHTLEVSDWVVAPARSVRI
jgi:hypothetical protein